MYGRLNLCMGIQKPAAETAGCMYSDQLSMIWPPVTGMAWPVSYFCSTQ